MINLLPQQLKSERQYGRRNVSMLGYISALILTAVLTASVMLISLGFVGSDKVILQDSITKSEKQISSLEAEVKSVEEVSNRLETAKKISEGSLQFSELIPSIGAVLPQGVVLNALSLTGGFDDPLKLDVDIANAELASVLIRNLVESELFEAADISSLTPKDSSDETSSSQKYRYSASVSASFTKKKTQVNPVTEKTE